MRRRLAALIVATVALTPRPGLAAPAQTDVEFTRNFQTASADCPQPLYFETCTAESGADEIGGTLRTALSLSSGPNGIVPSAANRMFASGTADLTGEYSIPSGTKRVTYRTTVRVDEALVDAFTPADALPETSDLERVEARLWLALTVVPAGCQTSSCFVSDFRPVDSAGPVPLEAVLANDDGSDLIAGASVVSVSAFGTATVSAASTVVDETCVEETPEPACAERTEVHGPSLGRANVSLRARVTSATATA